MKRAAALSALLLIAPAIGRAQDGGTHASSSPDEDVAFPTPIETAEYLAYTDFGDMEEFLSRLADEASEIRVDTLAPLPGEGPPGGSGEPALILVGLRRGDDSVARRPGVLIIGSQHGDEQSGKEATLQIIRDLAIGPLGDILDAVDVYAVPMVNPWGTGTGQRENALGLDLNRDHTRLASPAVASLHAAFAQIRPAVVIDMHELGPSAYDTEIGLPTHPYADSSLIKFGRYRILPYVANELAKAGFTFHEYVTTTPETDVGGAAESYYTYGPLLASYARNAFALRGAISMLFEVSSSREIHDLQRRTEAHTVALGAALEAIAGAADAIVAETSRARTADLARADSAAAGLPSVIPLRATYMGDPGQPLLVWLVLEPEGINTGSTDRWKPAIHVSETIDRPAGYLIPAGEKELIGALLRHGFELSELEEDRRLRVGRYPVRATTAKDTAAADAVTGLAEPYTTVVPPPPTRADDDVVWSEEDVPAGTVYLDLRQPASPLAAAILEPWSQDSWYGGPEFLPGEVWYPVMRLDRPLHGGTRSVPPAAVDGILGGP